MSMHRRAVIEAKVDKVPFPVNSSTATNIVGLNSFRAAFAEESSG